MNTIKIVLADDELLFRQGMKAILESDQDIEVLFDASDGSNLLNLLRATKIIRKEFPDIKIVALTSYFSKPFIVNMISIGAVAYLAKNSTPALMITTLKEVAEKGFYYSPQIMKFIHEGFLNKSEKPIKSDFDNTYFTKREKEVLELICKQHTTNEIAEKLFISPRTVEGHRNNLLLKTGSKNIAGLVVYAIQKKIVDVYGIF